MNVRKGVLRVALLGLMGIASGCASLHPRPALPLPTGLVDELPPDQRVRFEQDAREIQAQMKAQQARFAQQQRKRIDALNLKVRERYAVIERNGGLRATIEREVRALKSQISQAGPQASRGSQAATQLGALQALLGTIAFCTKPIIFDESSYSTPLSPTDRQFVVEPRVIALIEGCHLGTEKGQVQLVLPSTHETLGMNVLSWRNDAVTVELPAQTGRMDQAAQIVLVASDGTQSEPLDVQFQATRVWTYLDPVMHPGVLLTDCRHNTSKDVCEALANKGPPPTLLVAAAAGHFTFCCSSVSGTDRWVVSVHNGWLPAWLVYNSSAAPSAPDIPDVYIGFAADGYTTCNFFNRDGRITDYQPLPSSDPRFQGELDISWWVDHSCSGINYAANIPIVGPEGVPYW